MKNPSLLFTGCVILLADLFGVILSFSLAITLRYVYDQSLLWDIYIQLWPGLVAFPIVYALVGLYPGIGMTGPEELRRLTYGTSLVMIVLGASTFMFQQEGDYSRGAFIFAWMLLLFLIPLLRGWVRFLFSQRSWWGTGVVILGAGQTGQELIRNLREHSGLGLKPQAVFDDHPEKIQTTIEGLTVMGKLQEAPSFARRFNIRHAIVAMPGVPRHRLVEVLSVQDFPHLILIPDLFGLSTLWVSAQDLGGMLGLELRQRLLFKSSKIIKRFLDLTLIVLFILPIGLLMALLSLLVRIDSPGPIFYVQERLGLGGKRFKVLKFRSMYGDGEKLLSDLLERDPELRMEYKKFHKLKTDPRVTRLGRFLRKTSLDELPQIWNVIRGEMSLVGPRAYLPRELDQMQGNEATILKVLPGITGLWQVSGRSQLTFEERLRLDAYYVRNWSIWFDLYILACTIWVVFFGTDAY